MIKLGKLTDYAVVVMVQLAREGTDAARSASHLAAQTGVPEPTVAKVLKRLARAGLVESLRGAAGGYRLLKAPAKTSVVDIVGAMDGPLAIVSCVDGGKASCKAESLCPVRGHWDPVNTAIRAALEKVTLADMGGAGGCGAKQKTYIHAPFFPSPPAQRAGEGRGPRSGKGEGGGDTGAPAQACIPASPPPHPPHAAHGSPPSPAASGGEGKRNGVVKEEPHARHG